MYNARKYILKNGTSYQTLSQTCYEKSLVYLPLMKKWKNVYPNYTKVARSLLSSNVGHCIKTVYHSLVVKFTTWACNLHPRHTRQIKKAASVTVWKKHQLCRCGTNATWLARVSRLPIIITTLAPPLIYVNDN